ncbi:MAG: hypothetical protein ACR2K4_11520, partial [Candidatus Limnocylindria bacterium]
MLIGRVREHAGLEHDRWPGPIGEVAFGERAQQRLVLRRGVAIRVIRIDRLTPMVVAGELETRNVVDREAVVGAVLDVEDEDRESIHHEELGPRGLGPSPNLPLWNGQR